MIDNDLDNYAPQMDNNILCASKSVYEYNAQGCIKNTCEGLLQCNYYTYPSMIF